VPLLLQLGQFKLISGLGFPSSLYPFCASELAQSMRSLAQRRTTLAVFGHVF